RLEERAEDAQGSRLASSVRAEQAEDLARLGGEGDAVDGPDRAAGGVAKRLAEADDLDHRETGAGRSSRSRGPRPGGRPARPGRGGRGGVGRGGGGGGGGLAERGLRRSRKGSEGDAGYDQRRRPRCASGSANPRRPPEARSSAPGPRAADVGGSRVRGYALPP